MSRTAEQILKEIVANYVFQIAQLMAENERLTELNQTNLDLLSKLEIVKKGRSKPNGKVNETHDK